MHSLARAHAIFIYESALRAGIYASGAVKVLCFISLQGVFIYEYALGACAEQVGNCVNALFFSKHAVSAAQLCFSTLKDGRLLL